MNVQVAALAAVALMTVACASGPAPIPASSSPLPSAQPSLGPSTRWPPFEPLRMQEAVANALGMSCSVVEQRIRCAMTRPSGAGFESQGPDGTDAADRELHFTARGPIELRVEAQRLFATVADAMSGDPELSRAWQDQIWAAFADPAAPASALPNGVTWSATRVAAGAELVWSLSLTW